MQKTHTHPTQRRGISLVLVAIALVMVFAFVAFTVDIGHLSISKAELQSAADAAALASASEIAGGPVLVRQTARDVAFANSAANQSPEMENSDVELGVFDFQTKQFVVNEDAPNAVRVTAWLRNQQHFFAPVIGQDQFDANATAIGMLNPRDITFVVDLSGSMNDDTEPLWATDALNATFSNTTATTLVQQVFDDFGYGTYPGSWEYIGHPLGLPEDDSVYPEMTKDDGLLTDPALSPAYRIFNNDSEDDRKRKAYSWIIDNQIAVVMPAVLPTPDSAINYGYWEKYLDYIIDGRRVGTPPPDDGSGGGGGDGGGTGGAGGGPTPPPAVGQILHGTNYQLAQLAQLAGSSPANRFTNAPIAFGAGNHESMMLISTLPNFVDMTGLPRNGAMPYRYLPPSQDQDRVKGFNNPNTASFPSAAVPNEWRNELGYITYVQFMMDWGRDRSPDKGNSVNADPALGTKTPLSLDSPHCPLHSESTAGGVFNFPPRCQPMHSVRRALIAAIQVIKDQNALVAAGVGDRVSIVTFDGLDAHHMPTVYLPLTSDFDVAMQACTRLQASADLGATTATDSGLRIAREHLENKNNTTNPSNLPNGPQGRRFATKGIVLLTDGRPNAWESTETEVNSYISNNPNSNFYSAGHTWFNSPISQAARFAADKGRLYSVGMGMGVDYDFMDRIARVAKTDDAGQSPRSSGDPAAYEAQLIQIFENIIDRPGARLVE